MQTFCKTTNFPEPSANDIESVMKELDTDNDSKISPSEFSGYVRQMLWAMQATLQAEYQA
eukprot:gene20536-7503_t